MDVDIDPNEGGEDYIMQLFDDRFSLLAFIPKVAFAATIANLKSMSVGDEVLLGVLGSGPRVWLIRDPHSYALGVGDTDSKDVSYTLPEGGIADICDAQPAQS